MTSPTGSSEDRLRAALDGHGLAAGAIAAFCAHFALVLKWNATHNLTRVTDPEDAAVRHYLDCALPLLGRPAPTRFCDIGSGAGYPGLVAAVLWPEAEAILVEPARKRASFLQVAAGALGLRRVRVVPPGPITAPRVLSRATFSAGARGTLWPYVDVGGALWAWTSDHERPMWEREVATWPDASAQWRPYALPTLPAAPLLDHGLLIASRG